MVKVNSLTGVYVAAIAFAFALMLVAATPAHATYGCYYNCGGYNQDNGSDVTVDNSSSANVTNTVTVSADTGHNNATGGEGDDGGNGGDTSGSGNGGHGGNGGNGGWALVTTGHASAGSSVSNTVNSNRTTIDLCGCADLGDVTVNNHNNNTSVTNTVRVTANTGYNTANGGDGEDGGNGGDVRSSHHKSFWWTPSTSGNGGAGGNGGTGGDGQITTGSAFSFSHVANVVNTNITHLP